MPAAAAIDQHQSAKASLLEIFRERAEARAVLVANGWMDLQDAVDGLQGQLDALAEQLITANSPEKAGILALEKQVAKDLAAAERALANCRQSPQPRIATEWSGLPPGEGSGRER